MSVLILNSWEKLMPDKNEKLYKNIGIKISKIRKEQGLTQVQLSEMLGVSQQMIAAYEAGSKRMSVSTLAQWANILKISIDELVGLKNNGSKRGPASAISLRIEQIRRLPRTKQKFVIEMIDTVIRQQHS